MNAFDKICAASAFLLGLALVVLGIIGLFTGCKAHFTLPPVLGAIPAFVGWGIVRAVYLAWSRPRPGNFDSFAEKPGGAGDFTAR
jgi:hypothetical protein